MSRPIPTRDRFLAKMSVDDDRYLVKIRDILLAEPCRGLPVEPTQLIGHIYIGSQSNAESLRLLRRYGITHVLNCAGFRGPRKHPDMSPYEGLGIDYYEFKAVDNDAYNITQHFQEAFSFLSQVERSGGVCLIHCAQGINRSAATCAAYIMRHKNWPLLKVIKILKDKRRVVLSNEGFRWQLVKFARSSNLLEKLEEPKLSKVKKHDWFSDKSEFITERKPRSVSLDRFSQRTETSSKRSPRYAEGIAQMDVLSKCINDVLERERSRTTSRPTHNGRYLPRR